MVRRYEIPDSAIRYILFQRTHYLSITGTRLFRALRKLVPSLSYNRLVGLETRLRGKEVKAMYLADMDSEYLSIKDFLPSNCSTILDTQTDRFRNA